MKTTKSHLVLLLASMVSAIARPAGGEAVARVDQHLGLFTQPPRGVPTRGMHRAVIIEAPDRETALRVRRLLGEGAVVRDDTAVEWRGAQIDPDLLKRLSEQGLFLESP
jgi:hypothetical protein